MSKAFAASVAIVSVSCGWLNPRPAAIMSFTSSSGESSIPFAFCILVKGMHINAPQSAEFPPQASIFSRMRIFLTPFFTASYAADNPAKPEPTITTS